MATRLAPVRLPAADVAERLFGVDLWETPRAILSAIFAPHASVAVKACHASSKTHTAAIAVALALYEGGDVLTTAPTWEQVKSVLWGAVHQLLLGSLVPPREWGQINQTEIVMRSGARALGLSTNEGVRFQGWHARPGSFLLVIFDEAPGVRPEIYDAVEGISAGGDVRRLLLGNPVVASGPFYDLYASPAPGWQRFTIDAFDTPNLSGLSLERLLALSDDDLDLSVRPYLVTRRWVVERYHEWGTEHPLWQSRVRGAFPLQAEDALFSLAHLEAAERKPRTRLSDLPCAAGLDVAGPGEDETVLTVVQAGTILEQRGWATADPRGEVLAALRPYEDSLEVVNVDSAGLGWGMYLHLRDYLGEKVQPVNVGASPTNKARSDGVKFKNLKAELYWNARDWASGEMLAGLDRKAVGQLASIRYAHDMAGRVEIESKEDARKRGVRSPDWAESTVLALWRDSRTLQRVHYGTSRPLVRHGRR